MSQVNKKFNNHFYHRISLDKAKNLNKLISDYFYQALQNNSEILSKTHFFNGRYENIYIKNSTFEPLNSALNHIKDEAAICLNCSTQELSMDYWFNDMPPSHITDWHRHDVMDEQLSGVYYLKIPDNSGNLLIKNKESICVIKPIENDIIFFNPEVDHSVEKNESNQSRLSIGMNFGYLKDKL